ncbi:MAG: DUF3386 domain-containing protein [Oculatellaceae cyanobacterium Prado106]|jgi:hypothetical protein|nr:DUF3386 domain-containing protein [Oculatellaceae cyanobacterium Prado106]
MTEQVVASQDTKARDLFRAAYENRYTWDHDFPGYSADVTLKRGAEEFTGQVLIKSDMKAEILNVEDEQAKKEIGEQAWEIAIHRVRRTFEQTHSQNTFTLGETDETGAVEILMGGKAAGDRYKVRNNEVCLVHRHIHGTVVTINTFSSHPTEAGYLSHRYDSAYHDPTTGELKGESSFEDHYEKVGNYYALNNRRIVSTHNGETITTEFSFTNIKLLQPATV